MPQHLRARAQCVEKYPEHAAVCNASALCLEQIRVLKCEILKIRVHGLLYELTSERRTGGHTAWFASCSALQAHLGLASSRDLGGGWGVSVLGEVCGGGGGGGGGRGGRQS